MAFTPLNTNETLPGEPTKSELFTKTRLNFDDHETRISDLEAAASNQQPLWFDVLGQGFVQDGAAKIRVPFGITVLGVKLFVWKAGTSGTLSVDVERSSGGPYTTILTGVISAGFGSGDDFVANAPGIAISSLSAGDVLRLNIDSVQVGCQGFSVYLEYVVAA